MGDIGKMADSEERFGGSRTGQGKKGGDEEVTRIFHERRDKTSAGERQLTSDFPSGNSVTFLALKL